MCGARLEEQGGAKMNWRGGRVDVGRAPMRLMLRLHPTLRPFRYVRNPSLGKIQVMAVCARMLTLIASMVAVVTETMVSPASAPPRRLQLSPAETDHEGTSV
jgi:hypothetical protein